MQKLPRHRKAFYQKENDYKNDNRKLDLYKSFDHKYLKSHLTQSLEGPISFTHKPSHLVNKKQPKNDTELYCSVYSTELLKHNIQPSIPQRFLSRHKIDGGLRARMLDWMVEVMTSYKLQAKTYFAAVNIMDRYFSQEPQCLQPLKLHIIGVVSIMMATKMEEVYPLKLKTVYEKIAHKKISEEELTNYEARICYTLGFKLNSWTFFDLAMAKVHLLIQTINSNDSRRGRGNMLSTSISLIGNFSSIAGYQSNIVRQIQDQKGEIEQVMSLLGKFLLIDYDMYVSGSINLFSDVVLKLTFEVMKIPCQLESVFTSLPIQVELCKQQFKQNILNFRHKFNGINNISKYTRPEIVKMVEREIFNQ